MSFWVELTVREVLLLFHFYKRLGAIMQVLKFGE